ncbi:MAG: helix-turn-helix transcriptional regulator [Deltaproteobacteria bacterium]|nr:helix-turn-helix transcriptional regulator [Deltaproteobacteria bacterium]
MVTKKQKDFLNVVWDQSTLGSMISSLRQCDGISQTQLAEKIGTSKQFLNSVERNRKRVGIKFVQKVAEALDYPVEPFLELLVKDQIAREGIKVDVSITAAAGP